MKLIMLNLVIFGALIATIVVAVSTTAAHVFYTVMKLTF
jgi:hypothetical protein